MRFFFFFITPVCPVPNNQSKDSEHCITNIKNIYSFHYFSSLLLLFFSSLSSCCSSLSRYIAHTKKKTAIINPIINKPKENPSLDAIGPNTFNPNTILLISMFRNIALFSCT